MNELTQDHPLRHIPALPRPLEAALAGRIPMRC